jgi:23S rRNA pseudouridine2605 synthase
LPRPKQPRKAATQPGQQRASDTGTGPERLQKILARAGLASRREAEELIRAGRVSVNSEVATLGTRALGNDQVRLDGRLIRQVSTQKSATYLCHRSPGESLAQPREGDERETIAERLPRRVGRRYIAISPMPRIDGGLELLTSDGEMAARLQRLVRGLQVVFSLRIRGELNAQQIAGILEGELDSGARLSVTLCEPSGGEAANRWYRVETLGANGRDLRALAERQGATVSRILRIKLGGLEMDRGHTRGQMRLLDEQDITRLLLSDAPQAQLTPQADSLELDL